MARILTINLFGISKFSYLAQFEEPPHVVIKAVYRASVYFIALLNFSFGEFLTMMRLFGFTMALTNMLAMSWASQCRAWYMLPVKNRMLKWVENLTHVDATCRPISNNWRRARRATDGACRCRLLEAPD